MVNFNALVPLREENIKAAIGPIVKLPAYDDELTTLRASILVEGYLDTKAKFADIKMDMGGALVQEGILPMPNLTTERQYQYTKHALSQAVYRIKPEEVVGMCGYLIACPPELRALNYNYWHTESFAGADDKTRGNNVLLRTKDGGYGIPVLRAVVSQSYVPLDDLPILETLGTIIPNGAKMRSARGDLRSRFDVLWPNTEKEVFPGDPILIAVRVSNSETGSGSVRLDPMVYHVATQGCMLFPTMWSDVAIRHVGEAKNKLANAYAKVMGNIEPFVEQFRASGSDDIINEFETMDQMWKALSKYFKFTEVQSTLIKDAYGLRPLGTRAGVVTAIIAAAQDFVISSGEDMQRAAGMLVKLGWAPIKRFVNEEE